MSVRILLSSAFACRIVTVMVSYVGMAVLLRLLFPFEIGINVGASAMLQRATWSELLADKNTA